MAEEAKKTILVLADISGYTRFMTQNKTTLMHSQLIITSLMKAIISQIRIPLRISKLEGDAVFMYALKKDPGRRWEKERRTIGATLAGFFEVFAEKLAELKASHICDCDACKAVEKLRLKIIVHSGEAYFLKIGKFYELTGVDVILAHRLLKNSVAGDQYILMTQQAYSDIEFPEEIEVTEGAQFYDEIGEVKTFSYFPRISGEYLAEISRRHDYSARHHKVKRALSTMLCSMLIKAGLKRLPHFCNLPGE